MAIMNNRTMACDLENKRECDHIRRIEVCKPLLQEYLVPLQILPDLLPFIGRDGMEKVKDAERHSREDGVYLLLHYLMTSKEPGWFKGFIAALERNDFKMVADHLSNEREMKDTNIFKALICTFCKQIVEYVDPAEIIMPLCEKETLNPKDVEQIRFIMDKEGRRSAILLLLFRLPLRKNYWFSDFIATLRSSSVRSYNELAKTIEPAVSKACPDGEERNVEDEVLALNQGLLHHNTAEIHEYYEWEEAADCSASLCAGIREQSLISRPDPEGEEMTLDCKEKPELLPHVGAPAVSPTINLQIAPSLSSGKKYVMTHHNSVTDAQNMVNKAILTCDPGTRHPPSPDSSKDRSDGHSAHFSDSPVERSDPENMLLKNCVLGDSFTKMSLPLMVDLNDTACGVGSLPSSCMANSSVGRNIPSKPVNKTDRPQGKSPLNGVKKLEEELAKPALEGKNVIIVTLTDKRKFNVTFTIIQNHLSSPDESKVLFLVPTTELVMQQTKMYHKYLKEFKTCSLVGERPHTEKVQLSSLIENNHILIMTAEILLNALQRHDLTSLSVFTLMIFDECQEHHYNNIMARYFEEKYSGDNECLMPQVVGLTNSLHIADTGEVVTTMMGILALCANLDALNGISAVPVTLNESPKSRYQRGGSKKMREIIMQKAMRKVMRMVDDCRRQNIMKLQNSARTRALAHD